MSPAPPPLTPPARLEMVGRQSELAILEKSLARAMSGEPVIVVLQGETGIGKSRLAREVIALGEGRGMAICQGRFSEGAPTAHQAFSGAFLSLCQRGDLLREGLGRNADVLRSFAGLADSDPGTTTGPTRSEFPLAVSWAVVQLATRRPFLFVIDDLHWAEAASLDTVLFLAQTLADLAAGGEHLPVALLLLTRQPEPADGLARLLARLRRESAATLIELTGLDEVEVNQLVLGATEVPCSPPLLGHLMAASRGNPLFVAEALAFLRSHGNLAAINGRLTTTDSNVALPPPGEVVAAVSERIAAMPPGERWTLGVAALDGEEFTAPFLADATGVPEALVAGQLEALVHAGLLSKERDTFAMSHSTVRASASSLLPAPDRSKAHLRMARWYQQQGTSRPGVVAYHLLNASGVDDLEAGAAAAEAGALAFGAGAYPEAARFIEAAIARAGYVESLSPESRAELYYRCGLAHYRDMSVDASRRWFQEAVREFSSVGDIDGWGRALIGDIRVMNSHGQLNIGDAVDWTAYNAFMEAAGDKAPATRAALMAIWAEILHGARNPAAEELSHNALALAHDAGDSLTALHACFDIARTHLARLQPAEALRWGTEAAQHGEHLDDPWFRIWGIQNQSHFLLSLGRLDEAEAAAEETLTLCRQTHDWAIASFATATQAAIAVARGHFDRAEELGARALDLYHRSDYSYTPAVLLPALAYGRAMRGEWVEADDALDLLEAVAGANAVWTLRQVFRAWRGEGQQVAQELLAAPRRVAWRTAPDMFSMTAASPRLDLALALGQPELAAYPSELFKVADEGGVRVSFGPGYLVERSLGVCAELAGETVEAEVHLRGAIALGDAIGAGPEAARARLDLARLLHRLGNASESSAILNDAVRRFDGLRMTTFAAFARELAREANIELPPPPRRTPYPGDLEAFEFEVLVEYAKGKTPGAIADALLLAPRTVERALARIVEIGVESTSAAIALLVAEGRMDAPEGPDEGHRGRTQGAAQSVIMFTDIVDSTQINAALGDVAYEAVLAAHDATLLAAVSSHGGEILKHMGDGMFARFPTASQAIAGALDAQSRFPIQLPALPNRVLEIRVGIHAGEAIQREHDLIGVAVATTSRICNVATAGEVIVSEAARQLVPAGEHAFEDRGRFGLKGLSDFVRLYCAVVHTSH